MDSLNKKYFSALCDKFQLEQSEEHRTDDLILFEEGIDTKGRVVVFPTAIAPKRLMDSIPVYNYGDYQTEEMAKEALNVSLWLKKMQAGTGSSLKRDNYLAEILNISPSEVVIGAKGTDLFVEINDKNGVASKVSLVELQILQSIYVARRGDFKEVILHDIVGPETKKSLQAIWNKKAIDSEGLTYKQLVEKVEGISWFGETYQDHLPNFDHKLKVTNARKAPGGHAFFAVEALIAAYSEKLRPLTAGKLIASIGNGEDLSSMPDKYILGLMSKNNISIAMITTDKTAIDTKGGQIAVIENADGTTTLTIVEKAQAETSNQLDYFQSLGLREGDRTAFFNTNMALFNYDLLVPQISQLVEDIGEEKFLEIIAPDLIKNKKKQVELDGVEREYLQLEGAMGSVLLNLDRYWRKRYKKPLVAIINVDKKNRTKFFSPIKVAFDFFIQFFSDRFVLDQKTMTLIDQTPGEIPSINLQDPYYNRQDNTLKAFKDVKLKELKSLTIKGKVNLSGFTLKGDVTIINRGLKIVNLSTAINKRLLENETIELNS